MATVVTDLGELLNVRGMRDRGTSWKMGLVNDEDFVIDQDSQYADLAAVEADFPGYARQNIAWTEDTILAHKGYLEGDPVTFTRNSLSGGPQDIYGFFVICTDPEEGNTLMWGGPFDDAITLTNPGDAITVTPKFNANSAA